MEDDRDMKIAGREPAPEPEDVTAQETARQKQNGNWDKAALLGRRLAEHLTSPAAVRQEIRERQLQVFAAEWVMEFAVPSAVLLQAARTAFDACLEQADPAFYREQSQTQDYSFYIFRIRQDGNDEQIGQTFASLCGRAEDTALAAAGQSLYRQSRAELERIAGEISFAK